MKLLKLSPEVTRLRRIAKACAAGELTRTEYRQARREVIGKFGAHPPGDDEDTVSRQDMDVTQRREHAAVQPSEVVPRQTWSMWTVWLALVLASLLVPLWSWGAANIPPVSERDPNPATSPRYEIDMLSWADPSAPADLDPTAVAGFLTTELAEAKRENAPSDHGFSDAELEEIGRFLNAVGVHERNKRMTRADIEDLHALVDAQKARRGVSLIQLERIVLALQNWIRGHGYPLARAYLPAQNVTDATARVDVQLGVLRDVRVAEATADTLSLSARMSDLIGQPVRSDMVETRLNTLNRTRGLQAQASFVPGRQVGDTEMVLQVKQQRRLTGSIGLDNYGVEDLGDERLALAGQWHNPRGVGDTLGLEGFTTLDPGDHQYAALSYATPVARLQTEATLAFADISLGRGLPVEGDGVLLDVRVTDTLLFTRAKRREVFYRIGWHDLDWDQLPGQRAWFAGAGIDGHRLWDTQKIALRGSLEALIGSVDEARGAARIANDDEFWRLRGALNAWTPFNLPWVDARTKFIVDVSWQLTDDRLPATLRFGATGPYANKGFAPGETVLDQGLGISSALRFDAPLGQWWMFMDASYGEQEGELERWRALTSAGVGWEGEVLAVPAGRLWSRVTLAYPLSHQGTQGVEDDGTQIYWSLRFDH